MRHAIPRAAAAFVAAVIVLSSAQTAVAETPSVPSGSFTGSFTFETDQRVGTLTYRFRDGDVRMDLGNELDERFVIMLVRRDDGYLFQGFEGDGDHEFAFALAAMLGYDDLYDEFVDFFLFTLSPESPLHPCVHTQPEDGVLSGTFRAWDCSVTGSERVEDRPATIWELERLWGRDGQAAVFNDPPYSVWIDDELGVPIRVRYAEGGVAALRIDLVSLVHEEHDPAAFLMPDDGGL